MKKIISFILMLVLIMAFSAYGEVEITMQEIYDANQMEALLKNHESIYVRDSVDGEIFSEKYLTKDYVHGYIPDEESDWADFMTDDAKYCYMGGDYLLYLFIAPDGEGNFASDRAERYEPVLTEDFLDETVESVSENDGRITVTSVLNSKNFETLAEDGVTAGKVEYVLDAETNELISIIGDYTYEDEAFHTVTEIAYDAEAPEMLGVFMSYKNQTEDLRNVTVVSNPGTDKEESKSIQAPKGLIIGFTWADAFADKVELYADAACTEAYDPYADTDSDLTVYVKWAE